MARTAEMPSLCHSSCVICHAEPNSPAASLELAPPSDCLRSQALDPPTNAGAECPVLTQLPQYRAGNRLKIRVPSIFQSLFGWLLSQVFTGRMISVGTPSAS